MLGPNSLSRCERLTREADYERVYARRCMVRDEVLQVCACENELPYSRIGLSVGRKWGQAVVRNRLRRLFREAFRLSKPDLPTGLDLVLIPRRSAVELRELRTALPKLARLAEDRLRRRQRP